MMLSAAPPWPYGFTARAACSAKPGLMARRTARTIKGAGRGGSTAGGATVPRWAPATRLRTGATG